MTTYRHRPAPRGRRPDLRTDAARTLLGLPATFSRRSPGDGLSAGCHPALRFAGEVVMLPGVSLALGVVTWTLSPADLQADIGRLLACIGLWNMLRARAVVPALAHFLLRPAAAPARTRVTHPKENATCLQ